MARPVSLPARASLNCPHCGLANADPGDGVCSQCGNRLGATIIPPLVPLGTLIAGVAGHEVVGGRGGDVVVRAGLGETETVLLTFGSATLLALEAEALRDLHAHSPVPRPIALGEDPTYGPFLTLSLVGASARPLGDAARSLRVAGVITLGRQVVDLATRIAGAGFAWGPFPEDFWLDEGGTLALSRVRCVARIASAAAIDVRSAFEAAGGPLLPLPVSLGPTRLVRLFCSRVTGAASERLSPDAARAELTRAETEISSPPDETSPGITALSDRGLRRARNEDASATSSGVVAKSAGANGAEGPWTVLVLCDGLSSSPRASHAASVAAATTRDALSAFAQSGDHTLDAAQAAMSTAIRAADAALARLTPSGTDGEAPGTTLVAALVLGRTLVVGWVGDSRAYWVSPNGAELLTRDHSFAVESVLRGEMTEPQAMASPLAHALTRCLGPRDRTEEGGDEAAADIAVRELSTSGHLVLCTDGLWNYFPTALEIARIVRVAGAGASTALIARCLVNHALSRGGEDNVTVVVHRVPG